MKHKTGKNPKNNQHIEWFNLKTRLTLTVAIEVFVSIMISFGIAFLLGFLIPATEKIPLLIQIAVYSLIIATISTRIISRMFFEPIKKLRQAMKKVADGDFTVQLDTKSSSIFAKSSP